MTIIIFIINHWFLSKAFAQEVINDRLAVIGTQTDFNPVPAAGGPAGTFTITSAFRNISKDALTALTFAVSNLTGGNILLNADEVPGAVGSTLTVPFTLDYSDGVLSPGESFIVNFIIGLASQKPFEFLVNALGAFGEGEVTQIFSDLKPTPPRADEIIAPPLTLKPAFLLRAPRFRPVLLQ